MGARGADIAAVIGKGLVGAIPFVGPLAAEIVGAIIPNQRLDRLEAFLRKLEEKLAGSDQGQVKERFLRPEQVDLLEDAFIQASRAMSGDRKEYLASIIKNSLNEEDLRHLEYKRLLSILGQLNDAQVIILKYYSLRRSLRDTTFGEFSEKHADVLRAPMVHSGSSPEEFERRAIFDAYRGHLVELGLLRPDFKKPKRGELPEFDDKTGMIRANGFAMTRLGLMLLRVIDQEVIEEED